MSARRLGRPTIPPRAGERAMLSVAVSPDLKRKVQEAAAANGRALSAEITTRLELSFRDDEIVRRLAVLLVGRKLG